MILEFNGDTTKLDRALRDINGESKKKNRELRDINNALKFKSGNIELLAQKQRVLGDQISQTKDKLKLLKQADVEAKNNWSQGIWGGLSMTSYNETSSRWNRS